MTDADQDDIVFFVRRMQRPSKRLLLGPTTAAATAADGEFFVRRRDAKNMPEMGDSTVDWERSCLLNVLTHSLQYTLTVLLCHNAAEDTTKPFTTLRRVAKTVYASPLKLGIASSERKETRQEVGYPFLYFTIADFDDAFRDVVIDAPGQFIAVDLSCVGDVFGVAVRRPVSLFCGGLTHTAIKQVYADKGSWSLFGGKLGAALPSLLAPILPGNARPQQQRFIEVKGPGGKGYVQIGFEPAAAVNDDAPPPQPL